MPRSADVSAIFNTFIADFRSVLTKEVTRAVAQASKEVLKGKRKVRALAKRVRKTTRKLRRAKPSRAVNPAMAGKPGYSKFGRKLGRPPKKNPRRR